VRARADQHRAVARCDKEPISTGLRSLSGAGASGPAPSRRSVR
jgi:hypothetical protein